MCYLIQQFFYPNTWPIVHTGKVTLKRFKVLIISNSEFNMSAWNRGLHWKIERAIFGIIAFYILIITIALPNNMHKCTLSRTSFG